MERRKQFSEEVFGVCAGTLTLFVRFLKEKVDVILQECKT